MLLRRAQSSRLRYFSNNHYTEFNLQFTRLPVDDKDGCWIGNQDWFVICEGTCPENVLHTEYVTYVTCRCYLIVLICILVRTIHLLIP